MPVMRACAGLLLLLAAFLCAPVAADAQAPDTRKVIYGLSGGLSVSTMSSPEGSATSWPEDGLANFTGGGFVLLKVSERVSVRPELVYSGKGAMGSVQDDTGTWIFLTDRIHYLAVPILAQVAFKPVAGGKLTPYVVAGPEFAVKLKASQTTDTGGLGQDVTTRSLSSFVKSTDVGVALGGGVDYKRFKVEARYTLGLANVSGDASLPEAKNRAFAVIFGVTF